MLDRSPDRVNSVLAFMLRGIRRKWKQPIAFFFTKSSTPWMKPYNMLKSCIDNVQQTCLEIVSITTDQGPNFCKVFKEMKCSSDRPFIEIDNRKIYVMPDVPHLIKSTRNIIYNSNSICTPDGNVSWTPIVCCFSMNQNKQLNFVHLRWRSILLHFSSDLSVILLLRNGMRNTG